MNYKLNYISRLFQKTSNKRIEHYVISRIWHLLGNYDVKMTPQQYVTRESNKYALTDIYFPQIGLHVEVNEPEHYQTEEKIQKDFLRHQQIELATQQKIIVIDCRLELNVLHDQIDKLVEFINSEINKQIVNGTFKAWKPENEYNPIYWKNKGKISTTDQVSFHTIEDICKLFDADYQKTKRGFLRKGAIPNPKNNNQIIWWPSENSRSGWKNTYDKSNETITETHIDEKIKSDHYYQFSKDEFIRICFFYNKDELGLISYKYLGVFQNDREKSNPKIGTIWKCIGNNIDLETGEFTNNKIN